MQHKVSNARKLNGCARMALPPQFKALEEFDLSCLYAFAPPPFGDNLFFEGDENSLTAVFDRRKPLNFLSKRGRSNPEAQPAIDIVHCWLEAGEAHLCHDLAKPVNENHTVDL